MITGYDSVIIARSPAGVGIRAMLDDVHTRWPDMLLGRSEAGAVGIGPFLPWRQARGEVQAEAGELYVARDAKMEEDWDEFGYNPREDGEGPFAVLYGPSPRPATAIRIEDQPGVDQGFRSGLARLGAEPGLDILVNNAGVARSNDLAETTEAEFDHVFAVNVRAPFFLIQQGLERLRDNGRVINISSGVTRIAAPSMVTYSMTKGALNTLTFTLAKQFGERGITVNAVAPGIVDVDSNAAWLRDDPEQLAFWGSFSPFGRVGQPADIADVVAFLASPDSRWVTGQYIDATGGAHL